LPKTVWQIDAGWLAGGPVRRVPSPHCEPRDPGQEVSLLVIHNISLPPGQFGGCHIDELFTCKLDPDAHPYFAEVAHLKVSAHLLIDRHGAVTQYVPFTHKAWHAGLSVYRGRERCNDFSIGIELEGTDDSPYEDVQYRVLQEVTQRILLEYPCLNPDNIVGHCDIAPGRKTDPGTSFDWERYRGSLDFG